MYTREALRPHTDVTLFITSLYNLWKISTNCVTTVQEIRQSKDLQKSFYRLCDRKLVVTFYSLLSVNKNFMMFVGKRIT